MRNYLLLLAVAGFSLSSCVFNTGKRVGGDGSNSSVTRHPGSFTQLEQKGSYDVVVRYGNTHEVLLEGERNILDHLETDMEGNTLVIRSRKGFNLRPTRSIRILVTAPDLESVRTLGSGNITSETTLVDQNGLELSSKGSGDIRVEVQTPRVNASSYGSGNVQISGETREVVLETNGSGNLEAIDLKTESAEIDIRGSGNASITASKSLDIAVMGSGNVNYKGNPSIKTNIKGSGNVSRLD